VGAESVCEPGQQWQCLIGWQLIERQIFLFVGVFRHQLDSIVGTRVDPGPGPEADCGVQRLRARMKEI
jgi:hypothetical protein